jgi:hypothetical protein
MMQHCEANDGIESTLRKRHLSGISRNHSDLVTRHSMS